MRAQLDHAGRAQPVPADVTVQVIPLEAGAHPGMDSAFAVLQLEAVTDVVYVEGLIGNFYLQNPRTIWPATAGPSTSSGRSR